MNEPRSNPSLGRITVASVVVAALLTLVAVLPAELAIDPTGIGSRLGLTQMGRIKLELAKKAAQEP